MSRNLDDALNAWRQDSEPRADLASRIAGAAVRDFRFRKRVQLAVRAGGGSLAILAVIAAVWFRGHSNEQLQASTKPVFHPFTETNSFLVSASKSISNNLPAIPTASTSEPFSLETYVQLPLPDTERFKGLPDVARSSMEPVSEPATRAMNRFVKDLGSAIGLPKPKM